MKPKNILLIEDDLFLASILQSHFEEDKAYKFSVVRSGGEALELLKTSLPDLILLDLILPQRSGFEVMEAIRGNPATSKVPVIVISNLDRDKDIERGKQLGAIGYVVKAKTTLRDLTELIKKSVDK